MGLGIIGITLMLLALVALSLPSHWIRYGGSCFGCC